MKIDFSRPIKALDGTDRTERRKRKNAQGIEEEVVEPIRLCDVCITALDRQLEKEPALTPKEKYRRGHLAQRCYGAKEPINIDVEDVALLKELVGITFLSNILVAEVWDMLDGGGGAEE